MPIGSRSRIQVKLLKPDLALALTWWSVSFSSSKQSVVGNSTEKSLKPLVLDEPHRVTIWIPVEVVDFLEERLTNLWCL